MQLGCTVVTNAIRKNMRLKLKLCQYQYVEQKPRHVQRTFTIGLTTAEFGSSSVSMQQQCHLLCSEQSGIKNTLCYSRLTASQI